MTLSVVYFNRTTEVAAEGIRCCADSLISGDLGNYTPHAMKILPLKISYCPDYSFIYHKPRLTHTIGFTFAGNLSVAMVSYNLLSNLCENIQPKYEHVGTLPTMECVARLAANIICTYASNYCSLIESKGLCEIILFGFCPAQNDFKAFHIHPIISDGRLLMKVEEKNLYEQQYFAIGTGSKLLEEKVIANNGIFHPNLVREIIKNLKSEELGIGGFFQRGWSNRWGMRLYCDAMQNTPLGFGAPFCGFMLSPFELGEHHFISLPMFSDVA
jgi:hypothetical protein